MPAPTRFSEMLYRYLDRAESLMLVFIIAGVVCHFLHLEFAGQVLVIAFTGLAIVFFLNAYRPPTVAADEPTDQKDIVALLTQTILPKVLWISASVGAIALAMVHQHLEEAGYKNMFMIQGSASFLGLLLVGLAAAMGRNVQHLIPILYRLIPVTLAAGHFLGYY